MARSKQTRHSGTPRRGEPPRTNLQPQQKRASSQLLLTAILAAMAGQEPRCLTPAAPHFLTPSLPQPTGGGRESSSSAAARDQASFLGARSADTTAPSFHRRSRVWRRDPKPSDLELHRRRAYAHYFGKRRRGDLQLDLKTTPAPLLRHLRPAAPAEMARDRAGREGSFSLLFTQSGWGGRNPLISDDFSSTWTVHFGIMDRIECEPWSHSHHGIYAYYTLQFIGFRHMILHL
jgi:hypothetical protein